MKVAFEVQLIPIDKIRILNPRVRNKKKFMEFVNSIAKSGNKVPIKVSPRLEEGDDKEYDLVYGQGRLEAFKYLDETEIPAIVTPLPRSECLLKSVEENFAKRSPSSIELVEWIKILKEKGYSMSQIAQKINVSVPYVKVLMRLLAKGDERLIHGVLTGDFSANLAAVIATSEDKKVQMVMLDLHKKGIMNQRELVRAQKAYAKYLASGKKLHSKPNSRKGKPSTNALIKALKQATEQRELMKKRTQKYDIFCIFMEKALKDLRADKRFVGLLQAEKLDSLPAYLVEGVTKNAQVCQASI